MAISRLGDIAIIGMACRLPGADDVDQYWRLIREGRCSEQAFPADRFDRTLLYDPRKGVRNKSYTDRGCLISYRPFDPAVCPLPEAIQRHPEVAFLTLCEVAAAACRHAGFDPANVPHSNAGVYVGHTRSSGLAGDLVYSTYIAQTAQYLRQVDAFSRLGTGLGDGVIGEIVEAVRRRYGHRDAQGGPALGASMAARLLAESLGLRGPCMSFNAACASSLHALLQAVRALQLGRIELAFVGGASYGHSDTLVMFSQAQSVSATTSRPFDADADGLVVGEGYVVLLLKPLERALAEGNRIQAVIRGVGLSSDGRGKSLWAPRKEGQVEAVRRAYGPGIEMARLQYIEAHATSTRLGDATEIAALSEAFNGQLPAGTKIPLGSVKANIGHTLETAGLAGLLKCVLAMQHETIPPAIKMRRLNPQIDWDRVPFYVPTSVREWQAPEDGHPRRAAVNAFGIGGLNTHVVIDQFAAASPTAVRVSVPVRAPAVQPVESGEAIAVVGMGAVWPGAQTIEAYWDLLVSGRDPKGEVPPDRWNPEIYYRPGERCCWATVGKWGGFITDFTYDWRKHRIPPKQIAHASPLQFMILDAVEQAFRRAGLENQAFDRTRVGAVVGTIFGGDFSNQLQMGLRLPEFERLLTERLQKRQVPPEQIREIVCEYSKVFLQHMPALLDETGSFTASSLASRITKSFDLMGGAVAVDAGMASSLTALACSVDLLLAGDCDMVVCVGAQQDMGAPKYEGWSLCGYLAASPSGTPFDAQTAGVVPGEGCGVLLLQRLTDAQRAGRNILAVVRGIGAAYSPALTEAARLASQRALQSSGTAAGDVTVLETAGLGRARVDAQEIDGLAATYKGANRTEPLLLGTVVGQLGHAGGASGMASVQKAILALQACQAPASAGLEQPDPFLARHQNLLRAGNKTSPIPVVNPQGRLIAAVHSGGINEPAFHLLIERGTKVDVPENSSNGQSQPRGAAPASRGERIAGIVHFDATLKRKERMRQQSRASTSATPVAAPIPSNRWSASPVSPTKGNGASAANASQAGIAGSKNLHLEPSAVAVPEAPSPAAPLAAASNVPQSAGPSTAELETFLVNFVVEQTGYPAEIVELDADLEADLGIDSIKKAQLFGELREYFDITPDENLSLDDFPTLRHVLEFLQAAEPAAGCQQPRSELALGVVESTSDPAAAVAAAPLVSPVASPSTAELETFLVNFVVEQTGYPAEIVELDADLEADLGIDSIKKAQLFGELREYFDITPDENLSLDDFPTLRHVLKFLQAAGPTAVLEQSGGEPRPGLVDRSSDSAPLLVAALDVSAAAGPRTAELETFLVNFVVEQTGYPAEIVELDADLEADLGIDSIKKAQLFGELREYFDITPDENLSLDDFPTLRHVLEFLQAAGPAAVLEQSGGEPAPEFVESSSNPAPPLPAAPEVSTAAGPNTAELETFLVNFVVEQTGYPAEIVELDADLEADLGIDSIKKAQLFGELREYFDITPDENLSLDDFPTLRHVLEFLLQSAG